MKILLTKPISTSILVLTSCFLEVDSITSLTHGRAPALYTRGYDKCCREAVQLWGRHMQGLRSVSQALQKYFIDYM